MKLLNPFNGKMLTESKDGLVDKEGNFFPCVKGAYRFVKESNYTDSFGYQWNKFQGTQIDNVSNSDQSKERFFKVTRWDRLNLERENILEVGSGAGRFTHVVLKYTKANLYSVDFSSAVEANYKNNGPSERLRLFQASIYELPFEKESFDKVFCFGVLQHTPDFKLSIQCLVDMVKPGGELVVDFYPVKGWWTKIHAKYLLRPITKRMKKESLMRLIDKHADKMIRLYMFFDSIGAGRFLNRFIPICDIKNTFPPELTKEEIREWVVLDTFDMFSPSHDNPQKIKRVERWFKEFGMKELFAGMVNYGSNNSVAVVKGIK